MKEVLQFWPQIYVLVATSLYLLRGFLFGGQERTAKPLLVTPLIFWAFYMFVLVQGGFFNQWNAPQILYIICSSLIFIIVLAVSSKIKDEEVTVKVPGVRWYDFLGLVLLYWGNYFDTFIEFIKNN